MTTPKSQPRKDALEALIAKKGDWLWGEITTGQPYSATNPPETDEIANQRRDHLVRLLHNMHAFDIELREQAKRIDVGKIGLRKLRQPLTKLIQPLEEECGYLSRLLRMQGKSLNRLEHVARVARRAIREGVEVSPEELDAVQRLSEKLGWQPVSTTSD
jgi:uncharacterized protein (UPF0212 family)